MNMPNQPDFKNEPRAAKDISRGIEEKSANGFFITILIAITLVLLGCGADKPVVEEPPVMVESEAKTGPQFATLLEIFPAVERMIYNFQPVVLHFDVAPLQVTVNGSTGCIDKTKAIALWFLPSDVLPGDFTCKIEWIHPNGTKGGPKTIGFFVYWV